MAFLIKYNSTSTIDPLISFFFRWATKLTIVGGATYLVVNHEVFGANKYTKQILTEVRRSLPDTAEAFDKMPTKQELNESLVESWNSGRVRFIFSRHSSMIIFLGIQRTFQWLADAPAHTCQLSSSLIDKIKG